MGSIQASGGFPAIGRTEVISQMRCLMRATGQVGSHEPHDRSVAIALLLTIACGRDTAIFSSDNSSGTWSIVAVDADADEVGVALATCVADDFRLAQSLPTGQGMMRGEPCIRCISTPSCSEMSNWPACYLGMGRCGSVGCGLVEQRPDR